MTKVLSLFALSLVQFAACQNATSEEEPKKEFEALMLAALGGRSSATEFFNKIAGEPQVDCGEGSVKLTVQTTTPGEPPSRIFVKGQSDKAECAVLSKGEAEFRLSGCGMTRQRQLQPRGMQYSITVVVQMHPLFITKVDRAYHVRCFYMEADKTVTSNLEVSMLTTEAVEAGMEMPQCTYEIRRGDPNGPLVKYAEVGDKVYHVWECPGTDYQLLVHSCQVDDGQGNSIPILDERGCMTDEFVMKTPNYAVEGTVAQQETHVFKFADRINLRFNCQIKLCLKGQGGCDGLTPPNCGPGGDQQTGQFISSTAPLIESTVPSGGNQDNTDGSQTQGPLETTEGPSPPTETQDPETDAPTDAGSPAVSPDAGTTVPGEESTTGASEGDSSTSASPDSTATTGAPDATTAAPDATTGPTDEPLFPEFGASPTPPTRAPGEAPQRDEIEGSGDFPQPSPFPQQRDAPGLGEYSGVLRGGAMVNEGYGYGYEDPIRALLHEQEAQFHSRHFELDIQQEMLVLEPEEAAGLPDHLRNRDGVHRDVPVEDHEEFGLQASSPPRNPSDICLSTAGFALLVSILGLTLLSAGIAAALAMAKVRRGRRRGGGIAPLIKGYPTAANPHGGIENYAGSCSSSSVVSTSGTWDSRPSSAASRQGHRRHGPAHSLHHSHQRYAQPTF